MKHTYTEEQKEKDLLIKDLCCRLPYGVKVKISSMESPLTVLSINTNGETWVKGDKGYPFEIDWENCKLYLIPLSSMTEEQKRDLTKLFNCTVVITKWEIVFPNYYDSNMDNWNKVFNWCYKNNFDCNGLISSGLAIDATNLNIYDTRI